MSLRSASPHASPARPIAPGFTLIELLTVIAIIGILAAIVIPTVGTVREKAQRAVDASNLREIIKAAQLHASEHGDRLPDPRMVPPSALTSANPALLWPGILARRGHLTDPSFWFSKIDPHFDGRFPSAILDPEDASQRSLDAGFARQPLAWEFAGGLRLGDPATMPVAWTRGLQANGTWSATSGVYRDLGGFIGFLGGNVAFFSGTGTGPEDGILTSNNSGRRTQNILQAVPTNAMVYGIPPAGSIASAVVGQPGGTMAIRGP